MFWAMNSTGAGSINCAPTWDISLDVPCTRPKPTLLNALVSADGDGLMLRIGRRINSTELARFRDPAGKREGRLVYLCRTDGINGNSSPT